MPNERSGQMVVLCDASVESLQLIRTEFERSRIKTVIFYSPEIYADPTNFLTFIDAHRPDLVIYDNPVPYEANYARFAALRRDGRLADQAVILTSTDTRFVRNLAAADRNVADVVVGKPFNLDELTASVQRHLAGELIGSAPA